MTTYQYDADGNQTEMSQQTATGWATTDTQYNAEGQAWDVLGPAVNGVRPETISFYDLDGESCESQVKQAGANGQNVQWTVTDTTYDADGNAYQTVGPANAAGVRPTSYSFYNGLGEMCFSQTPLDVTAGEYTQYNYDTLGEQTEVVGPAAGGVSSDTKTTYDAAGNAVTSKVLKAAPSGGTTWETTTTDYDNDGNVVSTDRPRRRHHAAHLRRGGRHAHRDRPRRPDHRGHLRLRGRPARPRTSMARPPRMSTTPSATRRAAPTRGSRRPPTPWTPSDRWWPRRRRAPRRRRRYTTTWGR